MAEGGKEESGGGWWGSWVAAAKEKTASALEFVSKDLSEFSCTMKKDTADAINTTRGTLQDSLKEENRTTARDKVKQGFSNFMEGITKVLYVEPEDTVEPKAKSQTTATGVFDRAKARLRAVQVDPGTYCSEPSGPPDKYAEWLKTFDIETRKGEVSELLVTMVEVRSLYTSLVPSEVTHQDFWRRYFYKVHQLEVDEARKQALMKRAEKDHTKEDSISWDDDWSGDEEEGNSPKPKHSHSSTAKVDLSGKDSKQKESDLETFRVQDKSEISRTSQAIDVSLVDSEQTETQSQEVKTETQPVEVKTEIPSTKDNSKGDCDTHSENKKVEKEKPGQELSSDTSKIAEIEDSKSDIAQKQIQDMDKVSSLPVEDNLEGTNTLPEPSTEAVQSKQESVDQNPVVEKPAEKVDKPVEDTTSKATAVKEVEVKEDKDLKTREKGDLVVVGTTDRISPSSESSGNKELSSVDDDWEQDFDVELTEEDMQAAEEIARKLKSSTDYTKIAGEEEDWESWE